MRNPRLSSAWQGLETLAINARYEPYPFIVRGAGVEIDFTKIGWNDAVQNALIDLADDQDLTGWRDKMFAGDMINHTENRAVLHTALRAGNHPQVQQVLDRMRAFVEKTHKESVFTDIVNIGIGGSDLGPRLVCQSLEHLDKKMNVHFVANVDGADIAQTLAGLNPQTTLFVIASKTFTTTETMMNAAQAKKWLGDLSVDRHMIALSTNEKAVTEFGIDACNMFPFWDWVGGRFSLWSAIGMSIALTYGFDAFDELLSGARDMDDHFKHASMHENLPVLLGMAGVWHRNFMNRPAYAVLPYAQSLARLPDYLQQLDMESNGKSVDRDGKKITDYKTGPIVFGQAGTNGQHAFHQWLHQGTDIIPCEFITVKHSPYDAEAHRVLNANATAQADALAHGAPNRDEPHRNYDGGRPSLTVNLGDLSPKNVGRLLALYEHKIFVQGIIWNINSFDQWGVELGKKLAQTYLA